jgi:hypothetical protein
MIIRYWIITGSILLLTGCSPANFRVMTRLNERAALTGNLPADPLRWRVITAGVDPRAATMFTLFGNEPAVQRARSSSSQVYPKGSILALATWKQQEDNRWFGGRIPDRLMSVEFVDVQTAANGSPLNLYRVYKGFPLKEATDLKNQADQRMAYVLSLRAAVMP